MQTGMLISGKYRLLRQLGAGGMGSVWAARNELTDRDFAVKFLLPKLADNKEALQRFFLEARACGQIKHPAVVDVYDMGQAEDGSPYLVMELLEGEGFDHCLARSGVFRPGEAAAWIAFVARGLEEAHVRGLVHRDLKPGNIFFALDNRGDTLPKILDFGVSKAVGQGTDEFVKTSTGAVLGSPAYMSPEQARGDLDIDGRSDVWSLGVILYEALTGRVPFDAPNYNALMVAIITKPHQPLTELNPSVPSELSQIIDRALEKDRAQRISTARELADRLEAVAVSITGAPNLRSIVRTPTFAGEPSPLPRAGSNPNSSFGNAPTPPPWEEEHPTLMQKRRSPTSIAAGAGIALLIVIAGAIAAVRGRPPAVAVAGRSAVLLTTSLARYQKELEQIRAEAAAQEKARLEAEAKKAVVLEPSELPPAQRTGPDKPEKPEKPAPSGKSPGGKPRKDDPHGGVDSAGF